MQQVALYARVSTDKQEREETIESQLAQLHRLVSSRGHTVQPRHVYLDDGYSGDLMARPGLDHLRDDARDGLLDLVLVHCPDRLARRYPYQVVVIEELQEHGCEVDFVNRTIAETPEDQMLLAMQGVIAEYERAKFMERSRRGRLYKLQSGILVVSNVPYGYRWVPRQGSQRGRIEIVVEQAEVVRQVFRWIAEEGLSILGVCRRLMERGVRAPKRGARWGTSTVQNLLRNRAYMGEFCLNRIMAVEPKEPPNPGVYRRRRKCAQRPRPREEWIIVPGPALIDRELFEATAKRLESNKRFAVRHAHPDNQMLLRCLLRCGVCGYSIIATWSQPRGRDGRVFRYYSCVRRSQPSRYGDCKTRCSLPPMKAEVLDEIVWKDLRELMSDPARIIRYAGLEQDGAQAPLRAEVGRLRGEMEDCNRQLRRLLDAYQQGAIELEDLVVRRKELDGRKGLLSEACTQTETALRDDDVRRTMRQRLPELVRQVQTGLDAADFQARLRLVRLLVDRVVVQDNLDVEIHYVLPATGRLPRGPGHDEPPPPGGSPSTCRTVSGNSGLHSQTQRSVADGLHRVARGWGPTALAGGRGRLLALRGRLRSGR